MAAAARGEHAVVYAFDESQATIVARVTALGLPLEEAFDSGLVRTQQIDPTELSPGEFACLVRKAVETEGVSVIGSLNGYLGLDMLGRQKDAARQRRLMAGMRQAAGRGTALTRQLLTFSRHQALTADQYRGRPRHHDRAAAAAFGGYPGRRGTARGGAARQGAAGRG